MFVDESIHYLSIATEASKRGIWMKAPGGNMYADLSALDPPREGILVQVGFCFAIIDVDDLILLSRKDYWFDGKYVSSSDTHLHHDVMMRRLDPEDRIISRDFDVVHRDKNPFNNRSSNLQWVDELFVLDPE